MNHPNNPNQPIKALSIRAPFGPLLIYPPVAERKRIETRSYPTRVRGIIAIHVSKSYTRAEQTYAARVLALYSPWLAAHLDMTSYFGCIVGLAKLVDCVPSEQLIKAINPREKAFGNYAPGRYGWVTELVEVFDKPIPAKGALGFWNWTRP